jgi:phenylalanyl-tRNA synthetase beta chain
VLTVDTGDGDPLQVVCGAPNARAGMKGVLGLPGAVVPANGMEAEEERDPRRRINGMMCSTRELELGDDHDGIIELPADAPVGTPFADYHGADPVFDVAITPNRPDCMGVYGIARDLAAAGLGTLKPMRQPSCRALPLPGRDPHRRSRRLPGVLWPRDPRRDQRPLARSGCRRGSRARASGRSRRWSTSPTT